MSPQASSQCCDYWRLPSLICVIPIFSDSWVRALRGTTSGSLPKASCRKGCKSLLPQQLDTAWQLQVISFYLYYCYLYLGALMIAWSHNAYNVLGFTCRCDTVFSLWLHSYCTRIDSFCKQWLMSPIAHQSLCNDCKWPQRTLFSIQSHIQTLSHKQQQTYTNYLGFSKDVQY